MSLITLFLTSFLAGSFVPLGSEIHLTILQKQGENVWLLLLYASLGNTLGGMSCYLIAKFGGRALVKKYLSHGEEKLDLWEARLKNKSEWVALFCWLPIVGELIATSIGFLSNRYLLVTLYMFIGKALRYLLVLKVISLFP